MGFLWTGARFKIVGSEVSTSNGGDAVLFVESSRMRLRFVCDRAQLLLDMQPSRTSVSEEWFSIDLIRRMLLGKRELSAVLNESYAEFIRDHLDEIESRFGDEEWPQTHAELKRLKVKRAKEMFG
jgi:hypothetical protein